MGSKLCADEVGRMRWSQSSERYAVRVDHVNVQKSCKSERIEGLWVDRNATVVDRCGFQERWVLPSGRERKAKYLVVQRQIRCRRKRCETNSLRATPSTFAKDPMRREVVSKRRRIPRDIFFPSRLTAE